MNEIKQEQLYDDLSVALTIIKKKLKYMLSDLEQSSNKKEQIVMGSELYMFSKCQQLITKYREASMKGSTCLSIVERFLCRIKEIIKQFASCVPKHKIQLLIVIKKLQLLTLKEVNSSTIVAVLELINSSSNSNERHKLKIRPSSAREIKAQSKQSNTKNIENAQKFQSKELGKEVSEVEIIMKIADQYNIIELDRQYFRGRYFDLKGDEEQFFNENLLRNRNIKNITNNFEREYSKFKTRKENTCINSINIDREKSSVRQSAWQMKTIESDNTSNLLSSARKRGRQTKSSPKRQEMNKTFQTIPPPSNINGLQSFRSVYEEKLKAKKNYAVKVKNMVMCVNGEEEITTAMAKNIKQINLKRWQFFKKSQQHLRYRYKYYQARQSNSSNNSIKYKTINPEATFTTLNYK